MLKFGDIFRWKEREYVFLAATSEILYAALILDQTESMSLVRLYDKRVSSNRNEFLKQTLYIFVSLSTPEFKDRIAHLHKTQHELLPGIEVMSTVLSVKDKLEIKKEILNPKSSLPSELKQKIDLIDITYK